MFGFEVAIWPRFRFIGTAALRPELIMSRVQVALSLRRQDLGLDKTASVAA